MMAEINRVEVPPNFGINVLNLQRLRLGKFSEYLADFLNPFNVANRVRFRASVDIKGSSDIIPYQKTESQSNITTFANIGIDSFVSILTESSFHRLPLTNIVSCFTFVGPDLLLTGTTGADIELWRILPEEAKCLYKFKSSAFPVHFSSSENSFIAILNRGKCMLVFDKISCVSGNTDEALFSPVIVDLLQNQPILHCTSFQSLVASVNGSSIYTTDTSNHASASWNLPEDCCKIFSLRSIGHLLAITLDGSVLDCAWSNGLVGVSTKPSAITAPTSIERTTLVVNPKLVDCKHSKIVTIIGKDLLVYSLKNYGSKDSPTFPIVTEFFLEKQVPVNLDISMGESAVGISISDSTASVIVIENSDMNLRIIRMNL